MKLSVIFPCKNQSQKLLRNLPSVLEYFDSFKDLTYDVLIQSDHSSDEQNKILVEGLKKFPAHVKLLPFPTDNLHCGKGAAVKEGILASSSDYLLFMDCDLATNLHVFDKIYPQINKYDCFIASREVEDSETPVKQPFIRRIVHNVSRFLIRSMFHLKGIQDTQCGYKVFKTKIAKAMVSKQIIDKFAFDVEYLYFLQKNGFSIKEVGCIWNDDGDSSVRVFRASKDFYLDLFKIKRNRKSYLLTKEEKEKLC